ncbi:hypothetical protein D3C71_1481600 [compost metagenome]
MTPVSWVLAFTALTSCVARSPAVLALSRLIVTAEPSLPSTVPVMVKLVLPNVAATASVPPVWSVAKAAAKPAPLWSTEMSVPSALLKTRLLPAAVPVKVMPASVNFLATAVSARAASMVAAVVAVPPPAA